MNPGNPKNQPIPGIFLSSRVLKHVESPLFEELVPKKLQETWTILNCPKQVMCSWKWFLYCPLPPQKKTCSLQRLKIHPMIHGTSERWRQPRVSFWTRAIVSGHGMPLGELLAVTHSSLKTRLLSSQGCVYCPVFARNPSPWSCSKELMLKRFSRCELYMDWWLFPTSFSLLRMKGSPLLFGGVPQHIGTYRRIIPGCEFDDGAP